MSPSEFEIDPERVRHLVLARLLAMPKEPLSRAATVEAVAKAVSPPLSLQVATAAATLALEQCERAGQVSLRVVPARGKRPSSHQPELTAAGRAEIQALVGRKDGKRVDWLKAQKLIAFASVGPSGATKEVDAKALATLILTAKHGLPATTRTLTAAVNRIAWRALGVETDKVFSVSAVQRHLLREIVPEDVRVDPDKWRRMLAMRAVSATGHDAKALTRALLSAHSPPVSRLTAPQVVGNSNDHNPPPQPSLVEFAKAVVRAAHSPEVARFHDDRAFIGSVWEHMQGRSPVGDMPLSTFKDQLITAHRQRLLRITRADLVGAMDPKEVQRSEARYQDATFHFVALEAGGVR